MPGASSVQIHHKVRVHPVEQSPGGLCCSCACLELNLPLPGPELQPAPSATDAPAVTHLKHQRPAPILYSLELVRTKF